MSTDERLNVFVARLREYDSDLYSQLERHILETRKEEFNMFDNIDWDAIETGADASEGFGEAIAQALARLQGEEREKFKALLKSGRWVSALTEAATRPPAQQQQQQLTPEQADQQAWQKEQEQLRAARDAELKRTGGRYERDRVYIKYQNQGLGKPYESRVQGPQLTQAQLETLYKAELSQVPEANREQVLNIRRKYRAKGLPI